ncbi:MAG: hypothetical protein MJ010_07035 [Paludibacteraceae bacterium]|nr:hypothetical protein [Paludibacteraceae bacterium]
MKKLILILSSAALIVVLVVAYCLFSCGTNISYLDVEEYTFQDGIYAGAIRGAIDSLQNSFKECDNDECRFDIFFEVNPDTINCHSDNRVYIPKVLVRTHHTLWRAHRDDNIGVALKGVCYIGDNECYVYDRVVLDSLLVPTGNLLKLKIITKNQFVYCAENECWIMVDSAGRSTECILQPWRREDDCFAKLNYPSSEESKIDEYIDLKISGE